MKKGSIKTFFSYIFPERKKEFSFIRSYGLSNPSFISSSTKKMLISYSISLLHKIAKEESVSYSLIRAISEKESNLIPTAIRYEPQLRNQRWYIKNCEKYNRKIDNPFNACSFGLMQVLAVNVFDKLGDASVISLLGDPELSLRFAVEHLKKLLDQYYIEQAISAYNAGHPTIWNRETYVKPILKRVQEIGS